MTLLRLPQEILSQILSDLYPADVVHVGQTCSIARAFVVPTNTLLWKAVYLQLFDDPRSSRVSPSYPHRHQHVDNVDKSWNWHSGLKRRCLALKAIDPRSYGDFDQGELSIDEIAETLLEIIDTAKSQPTEAETARGVKAQVDDRSSLNLRALTSTTLTRGMWPRLENFIQDSHVRVTEEDEVARGSSCRPVTRSMTMSGPKGSRTDAQSRLHVLYGLTERETGKRAIKGPARRMVYNWSHPVPDNDYGPFSTDGKGDINWPLLEALMVVILRNFGLCVEGRLAIPPGFYYSIPYRTLLDPTVPEDWAKVTGAWVGTYSFLDYADLFNFNTWNDVRTRPSLEEVPEACGDLMRLDLKLDPSLKTDPKLQTRMPVCGDLPTLYFSGDSRSYDPFGQPRLLIGFKGMAALCPGSREVRWKFIIR